MRDYGKVHAKFWSSPTTRSLSDDGRLLALYLLTSPHSTITGVFRAPDGYVCEDMKWTPERVAKAFTELLTKGFANRCETSKWVWVMKHLEWNPPENPNQRKSAAKVALGVPDDCGWKLDFMRVCGPSLGIDPAQFVKASSTVGEPFPNQEQKQEQKQDTSGMGGTPPVDMTKAELWSAGKSLLQSAGMPEKQCGSFVGKLVKDYGDLIVVDAVRVAVVEQPADPASFLKACCQRLRGERAIHAKPGALPRVFNQADYQEHSDGIPQ